MISIIIPIYNADKALYNMLKSIQEQSYEDFEVIMIDDGSIDQSEIICKQFEMIDKRFIYYFQENQGVSKTRNNGLRLAKGEYITFLDADDVIDQNYLEELLSACQNADIAVCDVIVERNKEELRHFTHSNGILNQTEAISELLIRKNMNSGPCAKLFKRSVIGNIVFPHMKTYEDILFVLDVFKNANTIAVTNKTGYHYIENVDGAMSKMLKNPSLDIIVATDYIMNFIAHRNDLNPECCYVTLSHLFQYVIPLVVNGQNTGKKFIEEAQKIYRKYRKKLLECSAIPWKEKMVFMLFGFGVVYNNRKFIRIKKRG